MSRACDRRPETPAVSPTGDPPTANANLLTRRPMTTMGRAPSIGFGVTTQGSGQPRFARVFNEPLWGGRGPEIMFNCPGEKTREGPRYCAAGAAQGCVIHV